MMITGAGNLGLELYRNFGQGTGKAASEVYLISRTRAFSGVIKGDVTEHNEMETLFSGLAPEVVLHTAAMTDVDMCEEEKERAEAVNVGGTKILTELCERYGAAMIYISTDYVFDGRRGERRETDPTCPINVYGRTKLAGERIITNSELDKWAILRTSFLHNPNSPRYNFINYVVGRISKGCSVQCDTWRYTKVTHCSLFPSVIERIITRELWGVYHIAGGERVTPYGIAMQCCERTRSDKTLIEKRNEPDSGGARRPVDPTLNTEKAREVLGFDPPSLKETLDRSETGSREV